MRPGRPQLDRLMGLGSGDRGQVEEVRRVAALQNPIGHRDPPSPASITLVAELEFPQVFGVSVLDQTVVSLGVDIADVVFAVRLDRNRRQEGGAQEVDHLQAGDIFAVSKERSFLKLRIAIPVGLVHLREYRKGNIRVLMMLATVENH